MEVKGKAINDCNVIENDGNRNSREDYYKSFVLGINEYHRKHSNFLNIVIMFSDDIQKDIWIKRLEYLVVGFNEMLINYKSEIRERGVGVSPIDLDLSDDGNDLDPVLVNYYSVWDVYMRVLTQLSIETESVIIKEVNRQYEKLIAYVNGKYGKEMKEIGIEFDLWNGTRVYLN